MWGATTLLFFPFLWSLFQSTRPVWGATIGVRQSTIAGWISIHAPRVGCDQSTIAGWETGQNFNPRAPCGARRPGDRRGRPPGNFNPRAPCGARPPPPSTWPTWVEFQSTRPVWGATTLTITGVTMDKDFNPRAPCGARRLSPAAFFLAHLFQSTRPVWGATGLVIRVPDHTAISIHAPRVGRDSVISQSSSARDKFQSTRPVWGATSPASTGSRRPANFNPRAPCGARQQI